MFIQAPTGTGKTISALFPSVFALQKGYIDKIFYVTAKTVTRQVAEDALGRMGNAGLYMRSVTLTAKDKICLAEGKCNPVDCPYAKGHFDRVNGAVMDIVVNNTHMSRNTVLEYAQKHLVCPHEFQLDITLWCDCVIGDYNHVFDPVAKLKRFFSEENRRFPYMFIVDEAHNLPDRARDMFSAPLTKGDVTCLYREFKGRDKKLFKLAWELKKCYISLGKIFFDERGHWHGDADLTAVFDILQKIAANADDWLIDAAKTPREPDEKQLFDDALAAYFKALGFIRVYELYDERYTTFATRFGNDFEIKLFCLDPSYLLNDACKKSVSNVMFSATLTPIEYFRDVLGGGEDDYYAILPSPFDRENLLIAVEPFIPTRYKDRDRGYGNVADRLNELFSAKRGNYFAFFSSYEYMEAVMAAYTGKYGGGDIVCQQKGMTDAEKEQFLARFTDESAFLAFLVLGGVFSEGIDLTGDRLIGAAVVGVGIPMITYERGIIRDYYDRVNGDGFDYAYVFPGINKVMQAAGRVIRTETDRGIIMLIDERYVTPRYKRLVPAEWQQYSVIKSDFAETAKAFWNKKS